ncbi:MAG: FKBP-type peptidyl-prolyl cis-trans isomerase [Bacteroides sp.]|nr:FKBP-type peptidyl-prolyl cis-trans isomerase [Bacteroides sp.]MCM1096441.1 FKBP-type peptidyl-prolyl cis-trans isomerase [Terasakiella sp.]
MKKLFIGTLAVAALATASCSKTECDSASKADCALNDSISQYYGRTVGSYVLADYQRFGADRRGSKEDIFKGIRMVVGSDPSDATLMGIQIGAQLLGEMQRMEEQGVKMDRATVLKYFKHAFDSDSLDMQAVQQYSQTLNALMMSAQQKAEEREAAERAAAPGATDNVAAGAAYVDSLRAADPEIKTSASGLSYKLLAKGDDTKIDDNTMVQVNYIGRLTDGTVFDQSPDGQPATFSPAGVIPGFAEGLKMLGVGGKAILYIPGNLAYGSQGVPQAGIGPDQMLVFEIEVAGVK